MTMIKVIWYDILPWSLDLWSPKRAGIANLGRSPKHWQDWLGQCYTLKQGEIIVLVSQKRKLALYIDFSSSIHKYSKLHLGCYLFVLTCHNFTYLNLNSVQTKLKFCLYRILKAIWPKSRFLTDLPYLCGHPVVFPEPAQKCNNTLACQSENLSL